MTDTVEIHLKNTGQKKHVAIGSSLVDIIKIFDIRMHYIIEKNLTKSL